MLKLADYLVEGGVVHYIKKIRKSLAQFRISLKQHTNLRSELFRPFSIPPCTPRKMKLCNNGIPTSPPPPAVCSV
jgi:hypothetical protein